jgi:AbrB family looped-hinge helix DNA binding protein
MRVTSKGQVTIPQHIREKFGIGPHSEVDFVEDGGRIVLVRRPAPPRKVDFSGLVGTATVRMSTDEILNLTRQDEE